jgi:ribonuclease BN (tRNA processing enzyme)
LGQYRNVKLTVVGCSPAWPNPGGAQSGYLAAEEAGAAFRESGAKRLLLTHRPAERPLENEYEQAYDGFELDL